MATSACPYLGAKGTTCVPASAVVPTCPAGHAVLLQRRRGGHLHRVLPGAQAQGGRGEGRGGEARGAGGKGDGEGGGGVGPMRLWSMLLTGNEWRPTCLIAHDG